MAVCDVMSACVVFLSFNRVKSSNDFQDFVKISRTKVGFVGLSEVKEISTP